MSRIYTLQDLQARSLSELHFLRAALQRQLAMTASHSVEAGDIFASLRVIDFAIRQRVPRGPGR